ncbi:MAG: GNAT family N-acetyltransferase [Chloroflexi bacterium]|nr:GNAT family N-acetyltransferase [Chloroflexota bacterium]
MTVPVIPTERLNLVPMTPTWITALLDGQRPTDFSIPDAWPDEHDRAFLSIRLKDLQNGAPPDWLARSMVLLGTPVMVGHCGFHGPPNTGFAEIGYTVFEPHRRNGYAEESIRGLMSWALETHRHHRFRLSIAPDNEPSLRLAAKLGFAKVGEQIDPIDGLEHVFELELRDDHR